MNCHMSLILPRETAMDQSEHRNRWPQGQRGANGGSVGNSLAPGPTAPTPNRTQVHSRFNSLDLRLQRRVLVRHCYPPRELANGEFETCFFNVCPIWRWPDIGGNARSRFVTGYGKEHWAAVKRVLRYVKGSVDKGLVYNKSASGILQGFSDADWAGDYETRQSTTGIMFIFGGAAVSWASKLQKTVALSTMEAEYMALFEASKEAVWLHKLIQRVTMLVTQSDNLVGPVNI